MTIKHILIGLGAAALTGGALLGGGHAVATEINEKKAAEAFEKRSKERYDSNLLEVKPRRFGRPKIKVIPVTVDGNGNIVKEV